MFDWPRGLPLRGARAKLLARLRHKAAVYSWQQFGRRVRSRPEPLLSRLDEFPDCVLVGGCQRSGTTVLTEVIAGSDGFDRFELTHDNELDGAQILAGLVPFESSLRVCFQSTYLNERFAEYWTRGSRYRLVWVLREPRGVVYSMLNNWGRFALNELFLACGLSEATQDERELVARSGVEAVPLARRACLSYIGKMRQLPELLRRLPPALMTVVDYRDLVTRPEETLRALYAFIDVPYRAESPALLRTDSLNKARRLPGELRDAIDERCLPVYESMVAAAAPRRP